MPGFQMRTYAPSAVRSLSGRGSGWMTRTIDDGVTLLSPASFCKAISERTLSNRGRLISENV